MSGMTIHGTAERFRNALVEYIEATYHVADPGLLRQRRQLLMDLGVIHQSPYLESTPRYRPGPRFEALDGLPAPALTVLRTLSEPNDRGRRVLFNPPYKHQAEALLETIVHGHSLVVITGTGSGKTETFSMPIISSLAREAALDNTFGMSGMRAMILYPMNALVNDQLSRLRALLGDARISAQFRAWAGRPPRLARYTSRTPYAGVRTKEKDQRNLSPFDHFYVRALREAESDDPTISGPAQQLIRELKDRGRWPAKPDLRAWFGQGRWEDRNGNFKRAVTLPNDIELVTRDEVQRWAPDLLVTNYSMLEYMLMRPIERGIFDQTRAWLDRSSHRFTLVLDEAHLYRGAAGAEVGLLIRRLRDRLGIGPERLQVITTTASFNDLSYAIEFASRLTGISQAAFRVITGDLDLRPAQRAATADEAALWACLDTSKFYGATSDADRLAAIGPLLEVSPAERKETVPATLHESLKAYGPLSLLVNTTMGKAQPAADLATTIFPETTPELADQALTNLAAMATSARLRPDDASLLPCRVHTFFRGLRGLWVCMDPSCTGVPGGSQRVAGKLFTQPRDRCDHCSARVLELFTCRLCGTAYARGYCDDATHPTIVWGERGDVVFLGGAQHDELQEIDLLLTAPEECQGDPVNFDLVTGAINPAHPTTRTRTIYLAPPLRNTDGEEEDESGSPRHRDRDKPGLFLRCGNCGRRNTATGGSPIQDHETKGDQPFQVLITQQLQAQPPSPQPSTSFAPLRGRKVLVFSDSRQVAARLAPNLQTYSSRDVLRPLLLWGWDRISAVDGITLRLEDAYSACLVAAHALKVRLRPELSQTEAFEHARMIAETLGEHGVEDDGLIRKVIEQLREHPDAPPDALHGDVIQTIRDRSLGLEALALGTMVERDDVRHEIARLSSIPGVAETEEDKCEWVRIWLRAWRNVGFILKTTQDWFHHPSNPRLRVSGVKPAFSRFQKHFPISAKRSFKDSWLPVLRRMFTTERNGLLVLNGMKLALALKGSWVRCERCTAVHPKFRVVDVCLECGKPTLVDLDPDRDEIFKTRKGFYREAALRVLSQSDQAPMSLIAAEHTAQLNASQRQDIFSKAEMNELLFQDVDLPGLQRSAIDVLSSTTTMEVGIDIGQLSGAALRNMPPSRASYQQRAGRAGRRATAIATVLAFGGSDTHDEHFFSQPQEMIAGPVLDPKLSIDNSHIARRHLLAFVLQAYLQSRIERPDEARTHDLFSVLGSAADFKDPQSPLSLADFESWLRTHEADLRARASAWLPEELEKHKAKLQESLVVDALSDLERALEGVEAPKGTGRNSESKGDDEALEVQNETTDVKQKGSSPHEKLLDLLLYKGVLPRYAFPTDVTTFYVFDRGRSTGFRQEFEYSPSQSAALALSQYAPGKQIWIDGKCYTSSAIYTPFRMDRAKHWHTRQVFSTCVCCGYSQLAPLEGPLRLGATQDCPACRSSATFGPARYWFKPSGFAHPQDEEALTTPDDIPETTYATRAQLTLRTDQVEHWEQTNSRLRVNTSQRRLLVSNTGPRNDGYSYCVKCGRIESTAAGAGKVRTAHSKPFPDPQGQRCSGSEVFEHVFLGTDFITDVALFSMTLAAPVRLQPADNATQVALRTLCEALSRAATNLLELEPGEILAEYRPALSPAGQDGLEAEVFLYDTLPGGAGYSVLAGQRSGELLTEALRLMENCPEHCALSCYRCLRSFRNRSDHGLLDRHTGASLARFLLFGQVYEFSKARLAAAASLLRQDLERHGDLRLLIDDVEVSVPELANEAPALRINRNGITITAVVINPIIDGASMRTAQIFGISELLVRKNLARATENVLAAIGTA